VKRRFESESESPDLERVFPLDALVHRADPDPVLLREGGIIVGQEGGTLRFTKFEHVSTKRVVNSVKYKG
jgi:hypothetical protein